MLDSCRVLQDEGFDVTYLPVKENGLIDLKQLEEAIRPDTCLVSVRHTRVLIVGCVCSSPCSPADHARQ